MSSDAPPLVAAGRGESAAGVLVIGETDDVTVDGAATVLDAAVEAAAEAPLPRHSALAAAALRSVLARHDVAAPTAEAVVRRSGGGLRVELRPHVEVDDRVVQAAAVRVAAVLRSYDHASGAVGVVHDTSV